MSQVRGTILLVLCCLLSVVCAYEESYEGYELIEVITTTRHGKQAVKYLSQLDTELDFWYRGADSVHVFVPPEKLQDFRGYLMRNGLEFRVINDHVQRDIEIEENRLQHSKAFNIDDFNSYEDIVAELDNLVTRCRADLAVNCEVYSIGQTYEARELLVFRIWKTGGGTRPAVWIDATTHAREWLGTASHLKILTHLVDDYATDAEVQRLVDTYDWYLMPVLNPDGYSYSWTSDRMWRKNKTPNEGSACFGTDLNRNFETDWGIAGASTNPCDLTYRGASAASELETQAVQGEAKRLGNSLLTSIHIHTYGQLWLIPWGGLEADGVTCKVAVDDSEMMLVANPAADAVAATYNTVWKRGNSCLTIYPASGITMDYFKAVGGVKYVATPELRGDSFVVDKSLIQPSYEELWNGIVTAIETIEAQP